MSDKRRQLFERRERVNSDDAGSSEEKSPPQGETHKVKTPIPKEPQEERILPDEESYGASEDPIYERDDESKLDDHKLRRPTVADPSEIFGRRHKKNEPSKRAEVNVTVETLDGQRIVLRVKPEHTVKHLLELCCRRINVNPNEHYFVHDYKELPEGARLLDVGLTQNDVLRLYKGKKTILQRQIRVIVKVRDVRVGSVFKDSDSLWHIIKILLARDYIEADLIPIVLYNKEEFIGVDLLSRVRLRDIGITTGTCSFKFLQLKKEDLDLRGFKTDDDDNAMTTLESLELLAAGPTQDTGLRAVSFKPEESHTLQYIGERQALAFKQPDVAEEDIELVLREEYFDLTIEEISFFYKETLRKHPDFETLNPSAALLLAREEMRELHEKKSACEETIIRVQLPDKMVLQGIFLPNETINDIKNFVKKYVKSMETEWELYRYDPKDILNPESTLRDVNCIPCAKLYMGGSVRTTSAEHVLLEDLNLVSSSSADEAALVNRGESLEQFFGSLDRVSLEHARSGTRFSGMKYRTRRQSALSYLRKSSGGLRRLRKSFGRASLTSKATASSSVSSDRPRRSMAIDLAHLRSIARFSTDDAEEYERRTASEAGKESDEQTSLHRETIMTKQIHDSSIDDKDPSSSAAVLDQPSTSKQSEPKAKPEQNK